MDRELYRNKNSRDNSIEIAIIQYFNERTSYKIKLLDYENGRLIKELDLEHDNVDTNKKYLEITKLPSLVWEGKKASETDFGKLENCFDCKDSDKCMGCHIFLKFINIELIA